MKKTGLAMSFMEIAKKSVAGTIRHDLEVQRRGVWTVKQQQDFIDSLIFDYPVPPLFFLEKGDAFIYTLDGQQRSKAMTAFYSDEFAMDTFVPDFKDEDGSVYQVAGKKYSELEDGLRNKLNATTIATYSFANVTDEEITEMFRRLNAGSPFTRMESIRIEMPSKLTSFINKQAKDKFFAEAVAVTERARVHFGDHEVILQTMMMFFGNDSGFSSAEIQDYTLNTELSEDEELLFDETLAYLNDCFVGKQKFLKKANVPVVFKVAELALENGIDPVDFAYFVSDFLTSQKSGSKYSQTTSCGSARKENVTKRLEILTEAFKKAMPNLTAKRKVAEKLAVEAQEAKDALAKKKEADKLAKELAKSKAVDTAKDTTETAPVATQSQVDAIMDIIDSKPLTLKEQAKLDALRVMQEEAEEDAEYDLAQEQATADTDFDAEFLALLDAEAEAESVASN